MLAITEWNDGCNECQVNTIPGGGLELGACTERFCFAPGDAFCIIPMAGPHASLNLATSLAIALYEYRRQWPAG